ncbi:hypothetical protein Tco_1541326 [Tanacetum coccineum]
MLSLINTEATKISDENAVAMAAKPQQQQLKQKRQHQIDFAKLIWDDIISKLKKKTKEKVIPYPRFLSLLLELKMEGYGTNKVTTHPTQIFSVLDWNLKKNQPEGTSFTPHMLAICVADKPVAFQAQKTKGKKPGAKFGHTKQPTSSKKHHLSQIEAAKSGSSSKRATGSKTGHLEKKTQSSSAIDTNLSQPLASTHVVAEMHKEDQQAAGGATYLGFTSEEGANPQLSSGLSAFIHNKPIYSVSTIIHSESASRCDANVSLCVDSLEIHIYASDDIALQMSDQDTLKEFPT